MKAAALAAALLRDRERPTTPTNNLMECFVCGRSYMRRPASGDDSARFCGQRCRAGFDAGFSPHDPNHVRVLTNVPLSAWLAGGTRYYEPVLRGSRAWRKLQKSGEWTSVHKLKNRPKKPNKIKKLQGDFSGPTDPPIRSDWTPSASVDPAGVPEIPSFLDRRPKADVPDESIKQVRRAA
jgi:hypothetical protein